MFERVGKEKFALMLRNVMGAGEMYPLGSAGFIVLPFQWYEKEKPVCPHLEDTPAYFA